MLIVCAFFSCSDNDEPVNLSITPVVPDATLSLAVQTDNRVKTKGGFIEDGAEVAQGITWDFQVKTLTVVVFNNGAYNVNNVPVGGIAATVTQPYGTAVKNPQVAVGDLQSGDVKMLLIANLQQTIIDKLSAMVKSQNPSDRKSFEDVLALTTDLGQEGKDKGLTMSSELFDVTIQEGINYIGFDTKTGSITPEGMAPGQEIYGKGPVDLVRTVAAVKLVGIELPQKPDAENPSFECISFKFDTMFVANVKSQAMIGATTKGGAIEVSAVDNDGMIKDFYWGPEKYEDITGSLKYGSAKGVKELLCIPTFGQDFEDGVLEAGNTSWANSETMAKMVKPCYVYPNQNGETGTEAKNYTLLVVRGDYKYKIGANNVVTEKNRYYTVIVNDESLGGTTSGDNGKTNVHIQRNTKYNITLQIMGTGSDKPFTPAAFAHVAAKVEVADWNVIDIGESVD